MSWSPWGMPSFWFSIHLPCGTFSPFGDGGALGANAQLPLSLSCILSNALGFFLFALGSLTFPDFFTRNLFSKAGILNTFGFALLLTSLGFDIQKDLLFVAAGIAIGVGSTCLFFCWTQILQKNGLFRAKQLLLAASLIMLVPFYIATLIPVRFQLIEVCMGLLPLCLLTLFFSQKTLPSWSDDGIEVAASKHAPLSVTARKTFSELLVPLLCIVMVSLINPVVSAAAAGYGSIEGPYSAVRSFSATAVALGILALRWLVIKKSVSISNVYYFLVPIKATALLLFSLFNLEAYSPVLFFIGDIAFCMISLIIIISSLELSKQKEIPVISMMGLFAGTMYLARLLGFPLGALLTVTSNSSQLQFASGAFLLLYFLSLGGFSVVQKNQRAIDDITSGIYDTQDLSQLEITQSQDSIALRCKRVSEEFELSSRAHQIMELLLRGRSVPIIAETLQISQNTVRTHTKALYTTLDIHSRQELINLVEAIEISDNNR